MKVRSIRNGANKSADLISKLIIHCTFKFLAHSCLHFFVVVAAKPDLFHGFYLTLEIETNVFATGCWLQSASVNTTLVYLFSSLAFSCLNE